MFISDITRCEGNDCPSKKQCFRYTERHSTGDYTPPAALWARREAGADACDMILPTPERHSTFEVEQ